MEKTKVKFLENLLYEEEDTDALLRAIESIDDVDVLFVYAYHYNWDDGFNVPQQILQNPYCDLSTALLIFDLADGDKKMWNEIVWGEGSITGDSIHFAEHKEFMLNLYTDLMDEKFKEPSIDYSLCSNCSEARINWIREKRPNVPEVFIEGVRGKVLVLPSI